MSFGNFLKATVKYIATEAVPKLIEAAPGLIESMAEATAKNKQRNIERMERDMNFSDRLAEANHQHNDRFEKELLRDEEELRRQLGDDD